MRKTLAFILLFVVALGCARKDKQAERILRHYIDRKVDMIRNYSMESAVALWNATVSGNQTDYQKLVEIELEFNKSNKNSAENFSPDRFFSFSQNVFTNQQDFELLRKLKYSGLISDTLLNRQLNVLYQAFMGPQIETEKYKKFMSAEIRLYQVFSGIKIAIGDKTFMGNQIDSIKKNSADPRLLKQIFEAYQEKGKQVAPDIIRMVKARNEFARNFGYSDFYQLSLEGKDQTPEKVKVLLHEIELKTRSHFFESKSVIDKLILRKFNLSTGELMPWHYNDDQTSYLPGKFSAMMDSLFRDKDPIRIASDFFTGIGIPVQDVFNNSDLAYRSGKASLTAMINVDFKNDIRLISSIQSTHDGMLRMMHLGGHASHYKSISDQIPYLLRTPNSVLSEGIARYFESLASNINWLKDMGVINPEKHKQYSLICQHLNQVDRLFRCRKLLVLAEFEREIYQNPDQNLNELWRKLNQDYLGISYPDEPNASFWAANKYATSLSCTTHNYVLADIFAAQLQHTIENKVLKETSSGYRNNQAIGQFLNEHLYSQGNKVEWEKLIEKVTGEPLNTDYFATGITEEQNTEASNR